MRVLTALSGLILTAAGAFCFAFYKNGYAASAFVLGIALLVQGVFNIISYGIGFRRSLLPDTVLAEGIFSGGLGVAVLGNMVQESSVVMLFGCWLLVCGASRFAESLAVSKVNPGSWFAVLPLGLVNTLAGFVMIIPGILSDINTQQLLGTVFILNGISILIYSVYMVKRNSSQKAEAARERAEAKKAAAEEKRKARNELRSLSEAEREAKIAEARAEKQRIAEERKAERTKAREELRDKRRPASEHTMEFTEAETAEIIEAAEAAQPVQEAAPEKPAPAPQTAASLSGTEALKQLTKEEALKEFNEFDRAKEPEKKPVKKIENIESFIEKKPEEEDDVIKVEPRRTWVRPTNIPVIERNAYKDDSLTAKDQIEMISAKREIVKLSDIEKETPEIDLPKVELPEPELKAVGGEGENRKAYLLELEEQKPEEKRTEGLSKLTPLTLEDLFADESFHIKPLSDRKAVETDFKLTQTFTFDWLNEKQ